MVFMGYICKGIITSLHDYLALALEEAIQSKTVTERFTIHEVHAKMDPQDQLDVCQTRTAQRKVIIATEVAETGVTLAGVRHVIDTGLCNRPSYDLVMGVTSLVRTEISQAAARQRAGRACREGPGSVFRLYTHQDLRSMEMHTPAGMAVEDPTELILQLLRLKVRSVTGFCATFIDKPGDGALQSGYKRLLQLGVVNGIWGQPTELGKRVLKLGQVKCAGGVAISHGIDARSPLPVMILVAMIEGDRIFRGRQGPSNAFKTQNNDLRPLLELFQKFREDGTVDEIER
jgi:HrpA-like RNA helicase